jgi:HEAT repeat protein
MAVPALGSFIVEFVKALLRTNYYSAEHREARRSVEGLFQAWQAAVCDGELGFFALRKPEGDSILVFAPSVPNAPLHKVVGAAAGELFLPKLLEFMERADLVAFTLCLGLTEVEFLAFLELMARPHSPSAESVNRLDEELLSRGIRHLTVLFRKDIIGSGRRLSWGAALALSRLGKDLSRLPIFKDLSATELMRVRAQILGDVLRPANNPALLSEILLNLDLVSTADRPLTFAEVLPLVAAPLRLATAQRLEEEGTPNLQIRSLLAGLCVASVEPDPAAATIDLAERLIKRGIVTRDELAVPLRRRVEIRALAETWVRDLENRVGALAEGNPKVLEESVAVLSELLRRKRYSDAAWIASALRAAGVAGVTALNSAISDQVLVGLSDSYRAALRTDARRRASLISILASAGENAAAELSALLTTDVEKDPQVLRAAFSLLGPREVRSVFLMTFGRGEAGETLATFLLPLAPEAGPDCVGPLRRLATHTSPEVRRLALAGLAQFGRNLAEESLTAALSDSDAEVCLTAIRGLATIGSRRIAVLQGYRTRLLDRSAPAKLRAAAATALGSVGNAPLPGGDTAESTLLACLRELPTGIRGRLLGVGRSDEEFYLAVCRALGKVGSPRSISALEHASEHWLHSIQECASDALKLLRSRPARP